VRRLAAAAGPGPDRVPPATPVAGPVIAALGLFWVLSAPASIGATCGYAHVEVRGSVTDGTGEAVEGAAVVVFVDDDPDAIVDLESGRDVWRTGPSGEFSVRGVFVDDARPRWWHRFSAAVDHCGREPEAFTLVVQAEHYHVRQLTVRASDGAVERISEGRYAVTLREPLELSRRPGPA
ncbi:MAG: hypothetical protein OES32_19615, partial [Acidobacteriota bacterium]|nr:hypothetical protein [Acidobacteriota bacterium]